MCNINKGFLLLKKNIKLFVRDSRVKVILGMSVIFFSTKCLAENSNFRHIDGGHSELNVDSVLTKRACWLDLVSKNESILHGHTSIKQLAHIVVKGKEVRFFLKLSGCLPTTLISPKKSLNGTLSLNQPLVNLKFIDQRDNKSPEIIRVKGVTWGG